MEFALGYLAGSGASMGEILIVVIVLFFIGVIAKALFGDH